MYYITDKNSETGKKFNELAAKIDALSNANKDLCRKYGFTQWRVWGLGQNISCVLFEGEPDPKLWRFSNKHAAYVPNKRTKVGKTLQSELESVPKVFPSDLNAPVGQSDKWSHIGYSLGQHEIYYGFITPASWENFIAPEDCEEITSVRFKELFNFELPQ